MKWNFFLVVLQKFAGNESDYQMAAQGDEVQLQQKLSKTRKPAQYT